MSMKLANEIKVSLVTVVCILALAVISKIFFMFRWILFLNMLQSGCLWFI